MQGDPVMNAQNRSARIVMAAVMALAVAACQGEKPGERQGAAGEILPGSASDAMLPLDTVRSQPPLAPPTEAGRAASKGSATGAAGTESEASASEPAATATATAAAPSPAASATPD